MKKIVSLFLISVVLFGNCAIAQSGRVLTVSGEAKVEVPPDFVRLVILITANDNKVDDAKDDVDSRTRRVIDAIELFDIEKTDLMFSGVAVRRN